MEKSLADDKSNCSLCDFIFIQNYLINVEGPSSKHYLSFLITAIHWVVSLENLFYLISERNYFMD